MRNKLFFAYVLEIPNFLSLFIFAFFMMAASPILIDIARSIGESPENMNLIITFFMMGITAGVVSNVFFSLKFKKKYIILGCNILLIPAMVGLIFASSLAAFYVLYFISGYLVGIIWINANNNMVQGLVKNKSSVVNLGHVFLALGALTSPLIASNLIARGFGWRIIFYIIIFLVLVSSILYIVFEKWKKQVSPESIQKHSFKKIFKYRNKNIFLVLSLVILVFYFIQETIIFTWYPTFLRLGRSFDVYSAGYVISVFWVGIMVGRLIISVLSYKVRADHILFGLCILSLISLSIAIFSDLEILNYIGIGLVGLGFSGFVPLMIASSSSIFENQKDMVLTILLSIGIASNTLAPVIIKATSSRNLIMSVAITIIFMFMSGVFIIIRYFYQKNIR